MARPPDVYPSEKQLELLRFILRHIEECGYQPSQAEMCQEFKITKNAVTERLKGLERHGVIVLPEGNRERAIRIRHFKFKAYFTEHPVHEYDC